jgi:hypothetical protein
MGPSRGPQWFLQRGLRSALGLNDEVRAQELARTHVELQRLGQRARNCAQSAWFQLVSRAQSGIRKRGLARAANSAYRLVSVQL